VIPDPQEGLHEAPNGDPEDPASPERPWWQRAVVYQIYPRSFAEHTAPGRDACGVGTLRGITEHLEHLEWLGVDAVWISPCFRSPMADFGYDVSDYCDIDPLFGTLADMDDLIAAAHARGIKVLLDWVPNHTSDEHPWFAESRSSRDNPRADWYVWRDQPANNWIAAFPPGDTAWQYDEPRGQYYLRNFTVHQPDLEWDVPEVEAAMLDTLRFWLDRGIDGFRMDVVHMIGHDLDVDDPDEHVAAGRSHVPLNDVPKTHDRLRRVRAVLDEYRGDRTSVGEVYLLDEAAIARYYGQGDELHMSFNFRFFWTQPTARALRERIDATLAQLEPVGAWPTWTFSNHDAPRHRQRHGGDERFARVMAVLLLTLPGTPFLYMGECLGLLDAVVPADRVVDPGGRDGCRAPIPWTADPLHGWPVEPWLPFPPEAASRNVASMRDDPDSILHVYRTVLHLRRAHAALQTGSFEWLDVPGDEVLAYRRGDDWTIVLNLGDEPANLVGSTVGRVAVDAASDRALVGTTVDRVDGRTAIVGRAAGTMQP
jgi:alpha-glucosidase